MRVASVFERSSQGAGIELPLRPEAEPEATACVGFALVNRRSTMAAQPTTAQHEEIPPMNETPVAPHDDHIIEPEVRMYVSSWKIES